MKMMMKSLVVKLVLPLLLVSLQGGSALAQGRIATVELRKVFDGYWKTKQADAALKDRAADIEQDHKTMLDDWKKAKDNVTLELDLRGRIIRAPSGAPQQAVMRGPIVLAFDNRLTRAEDTTVWLLAQPLVYDDVLSDFLCAQPLANTSPSSAIRPGPRRFLRLGRLSVVENEQGG